MRRNVFHSNVHRNVKELICIGSCESSAWRRCFTGRWSLTSQQSGCTPLAPGSRNDMFFFLRVSRAAVTRSRARGCGGAASRIVVTWV